MWLPQPVQVTFLQMGQRAGLHIGDSFSSRFVLDWSIPQGVYDEQIHHMPDYAPSHLGR